MKTLHIAQQLIRMTEGLLNFLHPVNDKHCNTKTNGGDYSRRGEINTKKMEEEESYVKLQNLTSVNENC